MSERREGLRLGIFVVGSFVALAGLAILFGGAPRFFSPRVKYILIFPEAPGITRGTPVRKSGVRIGEVSAMELDQATGNVRVEIEVEKSYLPKQMEEPAISRGILSGDATIDFIPKGKTEPVSSTSEYPPNAEIPGIAPINTRQLLNQAQGVLPNAQESIKEILATFRRFEQIAPKVESTLDEFQKFARTGREAIPELQKTNVRIQQLLGAGQPDDAANLRAVLLDIRDFVKSVKPIADEMNTILKNNKDDVGNTVRAVRVISERVGDLLNDENRKTFGAVLKNVESGSNDVAKLLKLVNNLFERAETTVKLLNERLTQAEKLFDNIDKATQPIAENAGDILKNLSRASNELSTTLIDIHEVVKLFSKSDGTVKQLLNDPSLYQNLNEAAASLTRTMIRAERVAKDLEVFADKVARRPETIGVGGALRPSSGLKTAPNSPSSGPILPSVPVGGPSLAPPIYVPNTLAPIPSLTPPGSTATAPMPAPSPSPAVLPPPNSSFLQPIQPPPGNMTPSIPPPVGVQYRPERVALPPPIYPQNE